MAEVKAWLQDLVREMGVEVVMTDDANAYGSMAQELDLERPICQFHMLHWVGRELARLEHVLGDSWQDLIRTCKRSLASYLWMAEHGCSDFGMASKHLLLALAKRPPLCTSSSCLLSGSTIIGQSIAYCRSKPISLTRTTAQSV